MRECVQGGGGGGDGVVDIVAVGDVVGVDEHPQHLHVVVVLQPVA